MVTRQRIPFHFPSLKSQAHKHNYLDYITNSQKYYIKKSEMDP